MTKICHDFLSCCPVCPAPMFQDLSQILPGSKTWHKICWRGVTKKALSRQQGSETSGHGVGKVGLFENNCPDFPGRNFYEIKLSTNFFSGWDTPEQTQTWLFAIFKWNSLCPFALFYGLAFALFCAICALSAFGRV